jgi:hypothetical protein
VAEEFERQWEREEAAGRDGEVPLEEGEKVGRHEKWRLEVRGWKLKE